MTPDSTVSDVDLARDAARAAHDKGATDVVVIDVADLMAICGYFVVASASNPRLVKTVVEAVEERLGVLHGVKPRSVEGLDGRRWVLLDYGDIVVHIFDADERQYYRIERLYSDAPRLEWAPPSEPSAPGNSNAPNNEETSVAGDGGS